MNVFEALREDHDIQRKLLELLAETTGDEESRRQGFKALKTELTGHAAAEEQCFYAHLMQHEQTQDKARHSVAEHHDIDECLEKLEETDYSSPEWLKSLKELQHLVTHHLDEEEQEVFQMAGKVLTDKQKSDLAGQYRQEMRKRRNE
ncbi:hemerythrin domain-containing protein [Marinobacter adhaerens]|uniref:Hemerythrin domain-containing protein n=1 Tax=Marinobacter adhaerens TaxID=1033846 RepID=A0A851HUD8_9GAMM|nr:MULTISPECIES: hemerythrin domain-containing protein [Marinobacter]NWN92623.1 hemerythrin domain-containing protein [Marinobacter adhaerens]